MTHLYHLDILTENWSGSERASPRHVRIQKRRDGRWGPIPIINLTCIQTIGKKHFY
jgi:hypothetical protein